MLAVDYPAVGGMAEDGGTFLETHSYYLDFYCPKLLRPQLSSLKQRIVTPLHNLKILHPDHRNQQFRTVLHRHVHLLAQIMTPKACGLHQQLLLLALAKLFDGLEFGNQDVIPQLG